MGPSYASARDAIASPFIRSWASQCAPEDLIDPDWQRRSKAWAQWAMEHVDMMSGFAGRTYVSLTLNGSFYTNSPEPVTISPHLEIPAHVMNTSAAWFPQTLAAAGNGLLFSTWLPDEVVAIKRSVFGAPFTDPSVITEPLVRSRAGLVSTVTTLTKALGSQWSQVEAQLVSDPGAITERVVTGFTEAEIVRLVPGLADRDVRITFDEKLAAKAGARAARRVGVWRIHADDGFGPTALPAVTGRLTRSSMFTDRLFRPEADGVGALLVRALLLSRLSNVATGAVKEDVAAAPIGLRIVPARPGERMPEASLAAASAFVQAFPNSDMAWEAVDRWMQERSRETDIVLTTTREGFTHAHRSVSRSVRRAEDPARDDVNVLLPLAWESGSRVVRLTYRQARAS